VKEIRQFKRELDEYVILINRTSYLSRKTDLREIGWSGMDWNDLAQDRDWGRALVNTVIDLWVP
jgi:hypothetical protein